MLFHSN